MAFIRQLQGEIKSTDLQKLVFINTMIEDYDFYEFIPYKFGSYSFQLAEDLDILCKNGFLSIKTSPESIRIKASGNYKHEELFQIAPERGNSLIRKAYRQYPYFAINSEILEQIFKGEELNRFNKAKKAYVQNEEMLFTIGYEGKSIESFMNSLIQNDIRVLCDVRKNPLSRKFGFSKSKLEHITATIGIKYIHFPDLGIESDKRTSLETTEDYQYLFENYKEKLPAVTAALTSISSLLCSEKRIALMCYEKEPEMCHRHIIREFLTQDDSVRYEDL